MSAKSHIHNVSGGGVFLPSPYRGFLANGKVAVVTGEDSVVIENLGGAEAIAGNLRVSPGASTDAATHDGPMGNMGEAGVAVSDVFGVFDATPDASGTFQIDGEKSIIPIYVRSNKTQETPGVGGFSWDYGQWPGKDTNDGLTEFTPITEFGLRKRFPPGFRDGARGRIKLAATHCADGHNGFIGGVAGAPGMFQMDEVMGFGGGVNYHGFTMAGPPRMIITRDLGTLEAQGVDAAGANSASYLRFGGGLSIGEDGLAGIDAFLSARDVNGDQSCPILPIIRNSATGFNLAGGASAGKTFVLVADCGVMGNDLFDLAGAYALVRPGASIISIRDYNPMVRVGGAMRPGMLQKGGTDDDAQNPEPMFRGISWQGVTVDGQGASFHQCTFLDHEAKFHGDNLELKNCRASGGVYIRGSSRSFGWRNNTHGNLTNREFGCYIDPLVPHRSTGRYVGCDLLMSQKASDNLSQGMFIGGSLPSIGDELNADRGHHSGVFKVFRGLYGYGLSTPMVYGVGHSMFSMLQYSTFFARNVGVGIHVTDSALAQIYSAGCFITGTNTANLRMGGDLQGGTTGDPQVDETLANFAGAGAGQHNKNWSIHRPLTPIDYYAVGAPAAVKPAYGCNARIFE